MSLEDAKNLRDEGAALFLRKEYTEAINTFMASLKVMCVLQLPPPSFEEAERKTPQEELYFKTKLSCLLNCASACVFLERFEDALRFASEALEVDPRSGKAYYRRAQAHRHLKLLDRAEDDIAVALGAVGASDPALKEEAQRIIMAKAEEEEECRHALSEFNDDMEELPSNVLQTYLYLKNGEQFRKDFYYTSPGEDKHSTALVVHRFLGSIDEDELDETEAYQLEGRTIDDGKDDVNHEICDTPTKRMKWNLAKQIVCEKLWPVGLSFTPEPMIIKQIAEMRKEWPYGDTSLGTAMIDRFNIFSLCLQTDVATCIALKRGLITSEEKAMLDSHSFLDEESSQQTPMSAPQRKTSFYSTSTVNSTTSTATPKSTLQPKPDLPLQPSYILGRCLSLFSAMYDDLGWANDNEESPESIQSAIVQLNTAFQGLLVNFDDDRELGLVGPHSRAMLQRALIAMAGDVRDIIAMYAEDRGASDDDSNLSDDGEDSDEGGSVDAEKKCNGQGGLSLEDFSFDMEALELEIANVPQMAAAGGLNGMVGGGAQQL